MSKRIRWLYNEIDNWHSEQLISDQQARQLRARYVEDEQKHAWDKLIFPGISAVVFGLGVILFFAYNWADMHKFLKLALVFSSLVLAHGAGFYLSSPQRRNRGASDGLHLLGTMLFGAGIWLIAQIYHLDEHYPNAFLAWGLGALVFAWVLPSVAQGLVAVVLISLWSGMEIIDFHQTLQYGWLLILLGIIPLAWLLRSRSMLLLGLVSFSVLLIYNRAVPFNGLNPVGALVMYFSFSLACLYIALARLVQVTDFPESGSLLYALGFSGYLLLLFLFGFKLSGRHGIWFSPLHEFHWGYWMLPLVLVLIVWLFALLNKDRVFNSRMRYRESFLFMAAMLLVTLQLFFQLPFQNRWIYLLLLNGTYLAHCVILILEGIHQISWKKVILGCVLLSALLFVRFTDLFGSLLIRSMIFILLGIGLFTVGHFYSRQKRLSDA